MIMESGKVDVYLKSLFSVMIMDMSATSAAQERIQAVANNSHLTVK
jgi:hypothetical protein